MFAGIIVVELCRSIRRPALWSLVPNHTARVPTDRVTGGRHLRPFDVDRSQWAPGKCCIHSFHLFPPSRIAAPIHNDRIVSHTLILEHTYTQIHTVCASVCMVEIFPLLWHNRSTTRWKDNDTCIHKFINTSYHSEFHDGVI